jgi:multicomponent Na+:H+ antiporter subunit E
MKHILHRAFAIVRLVVYFNYELIASNLRVASDVLQPIDRLHPRVVGVPIHVDSELQLAVLSSLVTLTPGTTTLEVSEDRQTLYVHGMNVQDVGELRHRIRSGFERSVREVFP